MTQDNTKERFLRAVKDHRMTIEVDHELFRCVNFARPGSSVYQFRLTTWPGHLAISGDLDAFTFRRLLDMFAFFRFAGPEYDKTDGPNYGYWAEKADAVSRHVGLTTFSEDLYEKAIRHDLCQHVSGMALSEAKDCVIDARRDLLDAPSDAREAIDKAMSWRCPATGQHPFLDFWDHRLEDYSFGFKFSCHAIQWGIKQYDLHKQGRDQAAHDALILKGAV